MNDKTLTYGEIRKGIEVKLHAAIGISGSPDQVQRIRELAPKVAEGKMTYDQALLEVETVGGLLF